MINRLTKPKELFSGRDMLHKIYVVLFIVSIVVMVVTMLLTFSNILEEKRGTIVVLICAFLSLVFNEIA